MRERGECILLEGILVVVFFVLSDIWALGCVLYELVSLKHAVSSYLYLSRDACNYYCFLLSLKLVT